MSWSWREEPAPPAPQGVVGIGAAARRLLAAFAATPREGLQATANATVLVLAGPAEKLPWADGVMYVAPRPEAPALWLPTTRRPGIALDLLERALTRRHPYPPLLMLPEPAQLVPLSRLLPLSADLTAQIRARWGEQAA